MKSSTTLLRRQSARQRSPCRSPAAGISSNCADASLHSLRDGSMKRDAAGGLMDRTRRWTLPLLLTLCAATAWADDQPEAVDYVQDIKPLLSRRCYSCHGSLKQKNDLRLDTAALAIKGGGAGPAIVPGKSAESLLI